MEQYALDMDTRGRLVLPAALRSKLGLKGGETVLMTAHEDGSFRLSNLREELKKYRGFLKKNSKGRSLVKELLKERREDAKRE